MIPNFGTGELLRFLVAGILNTLFSIGVYWLSLYVGMSFQWAAAVSMVLGIIFSFNNHRAFVFKTKGRFVRYVLVWFFIYVVNIALIAVIRSYIGDYVAGLVLLPVNIFLAFMLMKRFVFSRN
jgi:putative flippase GtrA